MSISPGTGALFDHVISGTLHRQFDTATEITKIIGGDVRQDARLNEIAYFDLAEELHRTQGVPIPTNGEAFVPHVPIGLTAWENGEINRGRRNLCRFCRAHRANPETS